MARCGRRRLFALASDIRFASEAAKIAFFCKVGLSGADMGALICCRVCGLAKRLSAVHGRFHFRCEAERIDSITVSFGG